jgi:multicomponent Na+:H+ antiporter subunit B
MISLILRTASRFLVPLMLVFSVFLLLRGHNLPGGGFSGGLVAAGAFVLYAIAHGAQAAREALRVDPQVVFGSGLLLAAGSGIVGMAFTGSFLTGVWWGSFDFGKEVHIGIGTPLLFDVGVYLTSVGAAVIIVFALMEESK